MSGPFPKSKITRYSLILLNLPPTSRLIPFQTFPANSTSVWSGWRRFSAVQPPRFFRFHRTHSVTLWRVPIWVKRSRSAPKSHPATTPHVPSTESARFRPVDEAGRASFTHLSMWSSFALNLAFFSSADRVPARDVLMVGPAAPLLRNCRTGEKAGRKYCYVRIGTREGPRTGRICDLSLWRGCRTSPRLGLLQSGGRFSRRREAKRGQIQFWAWMKSFRGQLRMLCKHHFHRGFPELFQSWNLFFYSEFDSETSFTFIF
jgi:hypothetical protein